MRNGLGLRFVELAALMFEGEQAGPGTARVYVDTPVESQAARQFQEVDTADGAVRAIAQTLSVRLEISRQVAADDMQSLVQSVTRIF